MEEIGHKEASRSEYVQKEAMSEEIREPMMRKMDIMKLQEVKMSKIRS